jgi:hypothetical protein
MTPDPVALEVLGKKAGRPAEMCVTLQRLARRLYAKRTAEFFGALAGLDGRFFAYPRSDFGLLSAPIHARRMPRWRCACHACGPRGVADDVNGFALERARWTAFFRQVELEHFAAELAVCRCPAAARARRSEARC